MKCPRFWDGIIHEIGFAGSLVLRIMGAIYQCVCLTTLLVPGWPSQTENRCDSVLINQQKDRGNPPKPYQKTVWEAGALKRRQTQNLPQWVMHAHLYKCCEITDPLSNSRSTVENISAGKYGGRNNGRRMDGLCAVGAVYIVL